MRITTISVLMLCLSVAACKKDRVDVTPPQLDIPVVNTDDISYFIPFGQMIEPDIYTNSYEIGFQNPDAYVMAGCNGIIRDIERTESGSDVIHVQLSSNSMYRIHYNGVSRTRVHTGQVILAGDTLAQAGISTPFQFRVENIKYGYSLCPKFYGNNTFNLSFDRALTISNARNGTGFTNTCLQDKVNN
jgi:hypothetical protein